MKKRLLFLILVFYNIVFAFSQISTTTFTFNYNGINPPPCYIKDNDKWKTSHGAPSYYGQQGIYKQIRFDATFTNAVSKSGGIFTNYKFSKCNNYRIEITYKDIKGSPEMMLYAANNLSEKKDTLCEVAILPNVSDKKLIDRNSAFCVNYITDCTIIFPSQNTYWNPDKDYSQFWFISNTISSNSTSSFVITEIKIMDFGKVPTDKPTTPGNLQVTAVTDATISIKWNPSSDVTGIDRYEVFCGSEKVGKTTSTTATVRGLSECKEYTLAVQAVNKFCNTSDKASLKAATSTKDEVLVRNQPVNLSTEPEGKLILRAGKSVTLQPGFSVKASSPREFFNARIGCDDLLSRDFQPEDEKLFIVEEDEIFDTLYNADKPSADEYQFLKDEETVIETALDVLSTISRNEINIYPNPTTGELKVVSEEININSFEIFDITGKTLLSLKPSNSNFIIDISAFSAGVYFIKIATQETIFMKKLFKM